MHGHSIRKVFPWYRSDAWPYNYFHTSSDSIEKINFHLIDVVSHKISDVVVSLDSYSVT